MAKRDFDFKQFMLQKGDRVGIAVGGGLAILLLLGGVIMLFGKDTSLSPEKNAKGLNDVSAAKEDLFVKNAPSPSKFDELRKVPDELVKVKDLNNVLSGQPFELRGPGQVGDGAGDNMRRSPIVLPPTEFLVKVIHGQLNFHIFNGKDRDEIGILVDPPPSKAKKAGDARNVGGMYGRMGGGGKGGGPGGMGGGMGSPTPPGVGSGSGGGIGSGGKGGGPGGMMAGGAGGPGTPGGSKPDNKKLGWRKFDKLTSSDVLAENLVPLRAAEIVGSFPLRKQLEEFKSALHVRTIGELYDPARGQFGFRGFKVQRRSLAADGTTLVEDWADLDLRSIIAAWALNNGHHAEPEDPELEPILPWSAHLYMDRPIQIEEASEKYPNIETELPGIKKSLKELQELGKKATPPKNPFKDDGNLDPFGLSGDEPREGGPGAPVKPDAGDGGKTPEKEGNTAQQAPEFALIRFFDIYVKPGTTYEYRIKVLLNNPNYKREDVRTDLAANKEIESVDWVPVGHQLFVPEEIQYYAVDLRKDSKEGRRFANLPLPKDNQAVLQIHRWVDSVKVKPDSPEYPAGEWSIAERVVIYKGENIGQSHKVEIPIWMFDQASFVLATNPIAPSRDKHQIDIEFRGKKNDAVLVDFTNDLATYKRAAQTRDDGTEIPAAKIEQAATAEVLLLTPEGKLILRDYDSDTSKETSDGKERAERWDSWKERIKKIKEGGNKQNDFFNKGGSGSGGA